MPNGLARETSPYLRQHADNPVDWYPWGDAALSRAREEDRPILLSIGYSACHWCHVMAHESFEDPGIAALMNELFVCIKVDREERPDLDSVYMQAVQAMTGQGGWPMTVFLTPEGAPFYGGTYFPPQTRGGLPAFPDVLRAAHHAYRNRRQDVDRAAREAAAALAAPTLPPGEEPSPRIVAAAVARLIAQADRRHGGFGGAPKFPHPAAFELLLRRGLLGGDAEAAEVALTSLRGMAGGGLRDHLGGGFHRYSVDAEWTVPHFEKMLYDNAQLATVYLHAALLTGDAGLGETATSTLDYLRREMRLPGGGFASSQDADSEGEEGRYYLWRPEEIAAALGNEDDAGLACRVFGVGPAGSFDAGRSVLRVMDTLEPTAHDLGTSPEQLAERLRGIRRRLLAERLRRPPPGRDDKVVAAWNALALRAFAEAGMALGRPDYVEIAQNCAEFLVTELMVDGRLRRSWLDVPGPVAGFLDDVAGLGDALLTLYEATGDPGWFGRAVALAEDAASRFHDPERGYFDSAEDAEPLLVRPRGLEDNPLPAGQSLAAQLFLRLAALTGEAGWRARALEILRPLSGAIARIPLALGSLAGVADQLLAGFREIAVVGPPHDPGTRALLAAVWRGFDPYRVVAWGPPDSVPLLAGRGLVDGRPAAYVCRRFVCAAPITDPERLAGALAEGSAGLADV